MAKLWLTSTSRRGFLRRSPLCLAALVLAACRRTGGQVRDRATAQSVATPIGPDTATELALTPACGDRVITPPQTAGPFYRPNSPRRQSLRSAETAGQRLRLTGQVLGQDCQPLANCLVDFWQADAAGEYETQGDRLWGHQFTDGEGRYRLETVVPGIYPGRTRHLHVLVQPANGPVLTTQLYFPQETLNADDLLFQPELLMSVQESSVGQQAAFNFVVATPGAVAPTQDVAGDLWAQLQWPQAAYFILMRHALAPGMGDPDNFRLGDCATQRNLSAAGRAQARRTGAALQRRGVALRRVQSSQWCRCMETAALMAVGPVKPFAAINSFFQDRSTEAVQTKAVQQFMLDNSAKPGVSLMVTHFVNIAALTGSGVASGELVVMRVGEGKRLEVVGTIDAF
ncbi:histidine phosphatase family protein [filamentous cyanobacterium LEGE 11480]|uniref:Histidine phosphatase family protein n=1 Tax=Romeriopsis navalis LEGE 11480 TaxID=2777977 RepID=A0A928Z4Q2_9CYAN|nr:histidine phosphatase family protein [Romeriopsis navalis]MBE9032866.1 histidine phosphatase family protein [Romeriopsis navalis LEGE 11480]